MPKSIKEITAFNEGILLNASEKDIPIEAPVFSLNINPMAEGGILDAIYNNKLVATSNVAGIINFKNPVSWGESGIISGSELITDKNYNKSNIIISPLTGMNNQARCSLRLLGTKGRQEKLQVYDIEPWWELLSQKSESGVFHYPIFKTSAALDSDEVLLDFSDFGKAIATIAVADGDADNGITNGTFITLTDDTAGTQKHYIVCDTNAGGPATGTELIYKSGTITDADCSGTTITFTSEDHNLTTGNTISVSGTTNFNDDNLVDPQAVTVVDEDTFTMVRSSSSSATNETGTWEINPDIGSDKLGTFTDIPVTSEGYILDAVAVGIATTGGSQSSQNAFLVQLKAAIEHANGHNGTITVSAVPAQADGVQHIRLQQSTPGTDGNSIIENTISNVTVSHNQFSGGAAFVPNFPIGSYFCLVGIEDSGIDVNQAAGLATTGSSQAVTTDGTHTTDAHIGRTFVKSDGTLIGKCTARSGTTQLTFGGGLLNPLADNDNLFMIKEFDGVTSYEIFQVDNILDTEDTAQIIRRCFGTQYSTLTDDSIYFMYAQRETIDGFQHTTEKGTCLLSNWSDWSGNHIKGNNFLTSKVTDNPSVNATYGIYALSGSHEAIFSSTNKTLTMTGTDSEIARDTSAFKEGDIITLYHTSLNTNGNIGQSFKILKFESLNNNGVFTLDKVPVDETINSGTLRMEANLIKNGTFQNNKTTSNHSVVATGTTANEYKVNDWIHRAYKIDDRPDGERANYYNDYENQTWANVGSAHSNLVARINSGGWWDDTDAGHDDVSSNYYPFEASDRYLSIESEYHGSNQLVLAEALPDTDDDGEMVRLTVKFDTLSGGVTPAELANERFSGGDIIKIGNEYLKIGRNSVDGATIHAERGYLNSTVEAHAIDADILKCLNVSVYQDVPKEYLKSGQTYELSFKVKDNGGTTGADCSISVGINSGYFNSDGSWTANRDNYLNGINSEGVNQMEQRWIDMTDEESIDTTWTDNTFKFKIPKEMVLYSDLTIEFASRGTDGSKIGIDMVSLYETVDASVAPVEVDNITSAFLLDNNLTKDLILYDKSINSLKMIKNFTDSIDILNPESMDSIQKSPFVTEEIRSSTGLVAGINNNRELHMGFGPDGTDSAPKWLGYVNRRVFGKDETDTMYFDDDTVHSYDGSDNTDNGAVAGGFDKICLAGEHEYLPATWHNTDGFLRITHNAHSAYIGDNIVIREWADASNTWSGSGVWVVTSTSTNAIICKRFNTLDKNPDNNGFLQANGDRGTSDDNTGRICWRPYYYYAIKEGGFYIYRIFPETRIAGNYDAGTGETAHPDTGDGTIALDTSTSHYAGMIQKSYITNYPIQSISCCYNKVISGGEGVTGTGGGRINVLPKGEKNPHIKVVDVQRRYDLFDEYPLNEVGNMKVICRSFKWSNDVASNGQRPNGDINKTDAVFGSSKAASSTAYVSPAGTASDILETKGSEPTFNIDATGIDDNQPNDFGCRLWVQYHPGNGAKFKEGDRFLFCGLVRDAHNTNITSIHCGDRTPATTTVFPSRIRYTSNVHPSQNDPDMKFEGGPGVSADLGDTHSINTSANSNTLKKWAYFAPRYKDSVMNARVRSVGPGYRVDTSGSVPKCKSSLHTHNHLATYGSQGNQKVGFIHWGYNVGWQGKGGKWPEFTVPKYGMVPLGDNDKDGVIDGTGLVIPSTTSLTRTIGKNINSGPYGHYHQTVCSHAVGLLGSSTLPWVRHWGRSGAYDPDDDHYSGGRRRADRFAKQKDAPEDMYADRFLWTASDVHWGDYELYSYYTVTSFSKESNYGQSGNHLLKITFSPARSYEFKAGTPFTIQTTSSANGGLKSTYNGTVYTIAGYVVDVVNSSTVITSIKWQSNTHGTAYLFPFEAAPCGAIRKGYKWQSNAHEYKVQRGTTAIPGRSIPANNVKDGTTGYRIFHYAYPENQKTTNNVFKSGKSNAAGHYAKKWYTPPTCYGHDANAPSAFAVSSPGILFNIERLNYRAGYLLRPFSKYSTQAMQDLAIHDSTVVDMTSFPEANYHVKNGSKLHSSSGTTAGNYDNHLTNRMFLFDTHSSSRTRVYICDLDIMAPDDTISKPLNDIAGPFNTHTYNEERINRAIFAGYVQYYYTTASTSMHRTGADVHPVVAIKHSDSSRILFGKGSGQTAIGGTYYKEQNVWAGTCITIVDAATGMSETRYILASSSSGTYHFLKVHYPFKTKPDSNSLYYVWAHQNVCTASVRLMSQVSHGETNLPASGFILNDYNELFSANGKGDIYRDFGTPITNAASYSGGTKTIFTCSMKHNFIKNDFIDIYASSASEYLGTWKITDINTPNKFVIGLAPDTTGSITAAVRPKDFSSRKGTSAVSNPYYLPMTNPTALTTFGGLDMRKLRTYPVSAVADNGDEIDLNVGSGHTIQQGETLTYKSDSVAAQDGIYVIDDKDDNEIQVWNETHTNAPGDLYSNYYEMFLATRSGSFRMGEMRSGMSSWDKGQEDGNVIRMDSSDDKDRFLMQDDLEVQAGIEVSANTPTDSSGYFQANADYEYKVSYIYDGYQEGLLSATTTIFTNDNDMYSVQIKVSLMKFSMRLSHVCIYRRDNPNNLFKLVKELPTDTTWAWDGDNELYTQTVIDTGTLGATYESRTGLSELLDNISVKYGISAEIDGYLFAGKCSHSKIDNAANLIFRSKPGRFSTFDYVNDTLQLKSTPTAMANFMGRLYVFDKYNIYRVNQETLVIEDIFEGIGCSSHQSWVVTEYGMFFADSNGAYMHNGTTPTKISNPIYRGGDVSGVTKFAGTDNINNLSWDNVFSKDDSKAPLVVFDNNMQSILFLLEYDDYTTNSSNQLDSIKSYYFWSFNIPNKRWDLWEIDNDVKVGKPFTGQSGKVFLPIDSNIFEVRGGSTKKPYTWISKKINAEVDSVLKVFNKIKINGTDTNLSLGGSYKESSDRLLINTNQGSMSSSDVTFSEDSTNNASYKLSGSNRKGRWMQFKIEDMTEPIDSIGIIYRLRAVK